jgi:hypothetical protein
MRTGDCPEALASSGSIAATAPRAVTSWQGVRLRWRTVAAAAAGIAVGLVECGPHREADVPRQLKCSQPVVSLQGPHLLVDGPLGMVHQGRRRDPQGEWQVGTGPGQLTNRLRI